ncbi:MAG: hypothetical protein H0Z34_09225 [Brevibacillus sp.]|nr:hypothetical protein [Brevibacillus sp.]
MRQAKKAAETRQVNRQLFAVDFHDFLEKEAAMSDVELSQEFHISIGDVRLLRKQINR